MISEALLWDIISIASGTSFNSTQTTQCSTPTIYSSLLGKLMSDIRQMHKENEHFFTRTATLIEYKWQIQRILNMTVLDENFNWGRLVAISTLLYSLSEKYKKCPPMSQNPICLV